MRLAAPPSVLHAAQDRLGHSSHLFLRYVQCEFREGRLKLTGMVPSFYLKQLAQSIVQGIEGVDRVENSLAVVNPRGLSGDQLVAEKLSA